MADTRTRLEQVHRWKRVATWAPVLWFPLMVFFLLADGVMLAIALGLAGLAFAGFARGVVWASRCPGCGEPFRRSDGGFRQIWNEARCAACGLSLFELRREHARGD